MLYVNVYGAVPVKVNVTVGNGALPQTGPPPDIVAVGRVLTTTLAVPPKLVATQELASVSAVTWYVPAGAVGTVKVVLLCPVTVTGVVPSV